MSYMPKLAASAAALTLASTAAAQDVSTLKATDVIEMQLAAGQTGEQLEEQLAEQLTYDAEDQFENRRKIKSYAETLASQASERSTSDLSASLPIREITYDFDLKTYKICLPSSILYKSEVEAGTVEAVVSFAFDGLAEKNARACPYFAEGFMPDGALGLANYMEISTDMATAEKLHNAIAEDASMASFTCDEVTFVQGRFDTGPSQLKCTTSSVEISTKGGPPLKYTGGADDDSWISRSGGDPDSSSGVAALNGGNAGDSGGTSTDESAMDSTADSAGTDTSTAATTEPAVATTGTVLTETALELDRAGRIAVQRRLNLLGYSTRGVDGVFGPGTRAGISQWQLKNGLPVSGYLAADQLSVLNATSETLYANWLAANANNATTTKKKSTRTRKKRRVFRGRDGCLRRRPGNARRTIIPGQSRFCNRRRLGRI